ncbi:MAG TPA: agmatine deiminase family protein [Stellaceae bacterium]|jgi:agmatine deiminase|nr:agmatine deiminase family protein [Stellaceae bacterium]
MTDFPPGSPAAEGFFMPAEWRRHAGTWMAWPAREAIWHGKIDRAYAGYAVVACTVNRFEPVTVLARPQDVEIARMACGGLVKVEACDLDDSWMRDIGPSFLINKAGDEVAGVDWRFNAWGGKWPDCAQDAEVARFILEQAGIRRFEAPFVLEGGSIHVDGQGTILTSEQCLLNPNRNPSLSREAIEAHLKAWLGGSQVIWLGEGLENDDTDGHVDNLACFARPGMVLAASCFDRSDANYEPLAENIARLREARDAQGNPLQVVELPIPAKRVTEAGRLALSYVNSYICNDAVLVPAFEDRMDRIAVEILRDVFPSRSVVQIPALDILQGGGGIHCITQQQPALRPKPAS